MIRISLLSFLLASAIFVNAEEPSFNFGTGPDWRGERIELPPGFAPDMKWHGVETIRFAPGMFQPESDSFFSYVLVFLLETESEVTPEALHREILTYYCGLSKAVMRGAPVDTDKFTLTLTKTEDLGATPPEAKGVTEYSGVLNWLEPFATKKNQTLNLEFQVWNHNGQPAVIFCVSPQENETESELWKTLREIRGKFRFE